MIAWLLAQVFGASCTPSHPCPKPPDPLDCWPRRCFG